MNNLQYSVANLSVWQVSAEVLSIVEVEASVVPGHPLRRDHLDAHHEGEARGDNLRVALSIVIAVEPPPAVPVHGLCCTGGVQTLGS